MRDKSVLGRDRGSDYFRGLWPRWLPIVGGLVIGLAVALAYLHWAPHKYEAQTSVLVKAMDDRTPTGAKPSGSLNLDTEAQLVKATATVAAAADKLHLSAEAARGLGNRVRVSVPVNSDILNITYRGVRPRSAQQGSLAFAQAYLDQRRANIQASLDAQDKAMQARIDAVNAQLQAVVQARNALRPGTPERALSDAQVTTLNNQIAALASDQNQIRTTIVSPGQIVTEPGLPGSPSSPDRLVVLTPGIALGLLAGGAVVALRRRFGERIRTSEQLSKSTGLPVLAALSDSLHPGEVTILPPLSTDGRGYARLRNLVMTGLQPTGRPVALVAGVRQGGGPVAANLAAALARAGEDVVLVCADVFGPASAALLVDRRGPGLAEVLDGQIDANRAVQRVEGIPNLRVLGAGRDADRADALLQTRGTEKLIDELLGTASYVVIEAPSTTESPDAQTLAHVVGAAILVVELGRTNSREVLDACGQFESMGTPVLGAVVAHYRSAGAHDRHAETATGQHGPESQPTQLRGAGPENDPSPVAEESPAGAVRATADGNGAAGRTSPRPWSSRDVAPR